MGEVLLRKEEEKDGEKVKEQREGMCYIKEQKSKKTENSDKIR